MCKLSGFSADHMLDKRGVVIEISTVIHTVLLFKKFILSRKVALMGLT